MLKWYSPNTLPTVVHVQAASIISWTPCPSRRHQETSWHTLSAMCFCLGCVVFNATFARFVPFMMYTLVLEMSLHSETLSRFRDNQSILTATYCVLKRVATNTNMIILGLIRFRHPWSTTLEANTLTITQQMWFIIYEEIWNAKFLYPGVN